MRPKPRNNPSAHLSHPTQLTVTDFDFDFDFDYDYDIDIVSMPSPSSSTWFKLNLNWCFAGFCPQQASWQQPSAFSELRLGYRMREIGLDSVLYASI